MVSGGNPQRLLRRKHLGLSCLALWLDEYGCNLSLTARQQEADKATTHYVGFFATGHNPAKERPGCSMPFDVDYTETVLHVKLG
jgi:hypothetical protein